MWRTHILFIPEPPALSTLSVVTLSFPPALSLYNPLAQSGNGDKSCVSSPFLDIFILKISSMVGGNKKNV